MSSLFKHLAGHSSVYAVASMLSRMVGFLMIPIYTRYLTPKDYGVIELLDLTVYFISTVVGMRLSWAMARFYFEYKEQKERDELISTGILCTAGIGIALILLLCTTAPYFSEAFFQTKEYTHYFIMVFVSLFFGLFYEYVLAYLRVQYRSFTYVGFNLARLVFSLGMNILFVVHLKMGVLGVLYSGLISSVVNSSILLGLCIKEVGISVSWEKLVKMTKYSFPLIFSGFSGYLITFSDRFLLEHFSDLSQVGLYALAYKFGTVLNIFILSPFVNSWAPKRYQLMEEDKDKFGAAASKVYTYFSLIMILSGLALALYIKDVMKIVASESFFSAHLYVPIILLGSLFNAAYYHFNFGMLAGEKTRSAAYVWISAAALNFGLNYVLILHFHAMGAAIATALTYLYIAIASLIVSQRIFSIHFEHFRVIKMGLVAVVFYLCSLGIPFETLWLSLAVRTLLVLLFPLALSVLGLITPEEKIQIRAAAVAGYGKARAYLGR